MFYFITYFKYSFSPAKPSCLIISRIFPGFPPRHGCPRRFSPWIDSFGPFMQISASGSVSSSSFLTRLLTPGFCDFVPSLPASPRGVPGSGHCPRSDGCRPAQGCPLHPAGSGPQLSSRPPFLHPGPWQHHPHPLCWECGARPSAPVCSRCTF